MTHIKNKRRMTSQSQRAVYPESTVLTQLTFLDLDSGMLPSVCFKDF